MILESLFRIALHEANNNNSLPHYVHIRRPGFRHEYHIREIVSLASKVCGLKKSVGVTRFKAATGILRKATRMIHDNRLMSPVAGWVLPDVPKVKITGNIQVADLRTETCNVHGLAKVRLLAAANNNAGEILLRPEHRYAAVEVALNADILVVDTPTQSAFLQHFLARACIQTAVTTHDEFKEYYQPYVDHETESEWSAPHVANG